MSVPVAQSEAGEWRQCVLSEPITVQPGDSFRTIGNQLLHERSGVVISVREITETESLATEVNEATTVLKAIFFRRKPVSGSMATLLTPRKNLGSGIITFPFSDGDSIEIPSGAAGMELTNYIDTTNVLAKHILIRKTLLNSPDETNLTTMVGATCAVDCNANQPMSVRVD